MKLQSKPDLMLHNTTFKIVTPAFVLFLLSTTGLFAQQADHFQAEEWLTTAVQEEKCSGIAAGFSVDTTEMWVHGAGYRDRKTKAPFTPTTTTRIASIAKTMTAIAILQLFEQGKLALDVPIQTYLPDFPVKAAGDITIRHLLQHAAGIDAYRSGKERENTKQYADLGEAVGIFQDRDLISVPGEGFHYTTYGYVLLGLILEKVSGLNYEDYLRKYIWEPAGMTETGVEKAGKDDPGKSLLYHHTGKKLKAAKVTNLSDRVPGGGLYSTVEDLLQFGQALLGNRLLQPATRAMMWENSGLKQEGNPYGMGWYLYGNNPKYGPVYGHTGAQSGASTFLMLLPEVDTVIVVLSNTSGAMQTVSNITVRLFDVAGME